MTKTAYLITDGTGRYLLGDHARRARWTVYATEAALFQTRDGAEKWLLFLSLRGTGASVALAV